MKTIITIGTRPSKLALWQAEHVRAQLQKLHPQLTIRLQKITTKGDQILDRSLMAIGGKGLFLKEIEDALLAGEIDLAVHSLKDVPFVLPDGLVLSAILEREDPSDAWINRENQPLQNMTAGAVIGTTSLRRKIQLQKRYPHLVFQDLRGNVDTRLAKLQNGLFDGIVLATAGLKRLGLAAHITHKLDIVSAVGQGAIGIECRDNDADVKLLVAPLNHEETSTCVAMERYFLKTVQGSCQTPLGALCTLAPHPVCDHPLPGTGRGQGEGIFTLRCFLAEPDGSKYREESFLGAAGACQDFIAANFSVMGATHK